MKKEYLILIEKFRKLHQIRGLSTEFKISVREVK